MQKTFSTRVLKDTLIGSTVTVMGGAFMLPLAAEHREAAWHQGQLSDDDWIPWFTCRAVGDVILRCARSA